MFTSSWCPYCQKANRYIKQLIEDHPEYQKIELAFIDENKEAKVAAQYDYYYVPTFYVDGVKVHEGPTTEKIVADIFAQALIG